MNQSQVNVKLRQKTKRSVSSLFCKQVPLRSLSLTLTFFWSYQTTVLQGLFRSSNAKCHQLSSLLFLSCVFISRFLFAMAPCLLNYMGLNTGGGPEFFSFILHFLITRSYDSISKCPLFSDIIVTINTLVQAAFVLPWNIFLPQTSPLLLPQQCLWIIAGFHYIWI